jgi:tetrahydromethanopterin S-methyltransferase subunit G
VSDQPENLLLVYLRRIDAAVAELRDDFRETKFRLTTLEQQVTSLAATEASHYASLSMRLDRVEARLDRIERRLDLVEPASR